MRWLASTQSCMPSRMTLGLKLSRSPTHIQIRRGLRGAAGMSVVW